MNKRNSRVHPQHVETAVVVDFAKMEAAGVTTFGERLVFEVILQRDQLFVLVRGVLRVCIAMVAIDKVRCRLTPILAVEFNEVLVGRSIIVLDERFGGVVVCIVVNLLKATLTNFCVLGVRNVFIL